MINVNQKPHDITKMPKTLMCYICGKQYGTKSLSIHIKACIKKWDLENQQKDKSQRRTIPQPPAGLYELLEKDNITQSDIDKYNNKAFDKYNTEGLVQCHFCNRSFLEARMEGHRKICTEQKPFNPLPQRENNQNINIESQSMVINRSTEKGDAHQPKEYQDQDDQAELEKCSKCGRKFNIDRINKHESVCKGIEIKDKQKIDQPNLIAMSKSVVVKASKNGPQNSSPSKNAFADALNAQLIDSKKENFSLAEINKLLEKTSEQFNEEKTKIPKQKKLLQQKEHMKEDADSSDIPDWKKKSQDLQNLMKYNKEVARVEQMGGDPRTVQAPQSQIQDMLVPCPYCERKFNEAAAARHIPKCQNTIHKPKPPPGKNHK